MIESGFTVPTRWAEPSSPTSSVASKSSKRPRKVATTMCFTAKLALEWTGSSFHVPVGICCSVATDICCASVESLVSDGPLCPLGWLHVQLYQISGPQSVWHNTAMAAQELNVV